MCDIAWIHLLSTCRPFDSDRTFVLHYSPCHCIVAAHDLVPRHNCFLLPSGIFLLSAWASSRLEFDFLPSCIFFGVQSHIFSWSSGFLLVEFRSPMMIQILNHTDTTRSGSGGAPRQRPSPLQTTGRPPLCHGILRTESLKSGA